LKSDKFFLKITGKQKITEDILSRAQKVKLLLMDCDGVLTDGKLYLSANGEELKVFNVRDGQGLVSWHRAGFRSGIISGRNSEIVKKRATELDVSYIIQSSLDKTQSFSEILVKEKISAEEVAFVGDDIADIDLLKIVGFSIAVADAETELLKIVDYITKLEGGCGAVREITNLLLKAKSL
jgi:3-deoxy-D-manno-octulosonate 8-phosphate phosphatase (KDO 8-P phosphatase)